MKYKIIYTMLFTIVTGCANIKPVATESKIIDRPELNSIQKEELGNTLLEYFIANTQPSLRVLEQWGLNDVYKIFPPQILRPTGIDGNTLRFYVDDAPDSQNWQRNVCFDRSRKVFVVADGYGGCTILGLGGSGTVKIEPADFIDFRLPQFKQELIYNGKSGNTVKFLYREFSGNTMRAPFTQDVQYDLSEGKIIGFKGARIEILSSSNRFIEYKVLSSFKR